MFFNFNKFKYKPETYLQINIEEDNTTINIYIDNRLNENEHVIINEGYKDIIDKYTEYFNDLSTKDINYNLIYQDALKFMKYIEFKILCYMKLPTKIDSIRFSCSGPKLFTKAFENSFKFYLR